MMPSGCCASWCPGGGRPQGRRLDRLRGVGRPAPPHPWPAGGPGDMVEVQGALRRAVLPGGRARRPRASRWRPAAAGSSVAQVPHEHAQVRLRAGRRWPSGGAADLSGPSWPPRSKVGAGSSTARPCRGARQRPRSAVWWKTSWSSRTFQAGSSVSCSGGSPAAVEAPVGPQRRPVLTVVQDDASLELGQRLVAAGVPAEVVAAPGRRPSRQSVSVSRGMVRWIAHRWSGVSRLVDEHHQGLVPGGAGALRLQPDRGGVPVVAVGDHRTARRRGPPPASACSSAGSVIRQIRCSWSARSV